MSYRGHFPGEWATDIADSWRTGADITPEFHSVINQIDNIKPLHKFCSPSHINDLDMMQLGNGLSNEEEKTHFAMWCIMSTPLMIGCDLTKISDSTLEILKNKELIAINQDKACNQAYVVKEIRDKVGTLLGEVWVKELYERNEKAIAFLNRSESTVSVPDINAAMEYKKPTNSEKISVDKANELVADGAVLLDVRSADEYKISHLDNALNVPYTEIHAAISSLVPNKKQRVIVYCTTGKRSSQAKYTLDYMGYENVYYLGGMKL